MEVDWEAIIYEKGLDKKGKIKAFRLYKLFGRTQLGVREISVNKIEKDAKIATISCSEPDVLSTEFLYDREEREFLFETPTGSAEAQVDGNKKYSEAREEAKKYFEQAGLFSDMKNNIKNIFYTSVQEPNFYQPTGDKYPASLFHSHPEDRS